MRNNLVLIAFIVGALALYVMWETLTARIVAVESATGSYIYTDAPLPTEAAPSGPPIPPPSAPDDERESLNARLDSLEKLISANAGAIDAVLERIDQIETTNTRLHESFSANAQAIESVLQRLDQIEDSKTRNVSKIRSRQTVYFTHDDSTLKPAEMAKVDGVLADIEDDAIVSLRGYADTVGDNRYNYYLSVRRAAAVKRYMEEKLRAQGRIDAMLITIDGIGEEGGLAVTADGVDEPANRTVEILVFDRVAR
jgi:outer membrane protein OmpA-like peptidoglycan-associated protein